MPTGASRQVEAYQRQLQQQGFLRTYVWQDAPGAYYSEHAHDCETVHIILEGEMTLGQHGEQRTYRQGERCDVLAGTAHWARMGAAGCRYLIGER